MTFIFIYVKNPTSECLSSHINDRGSKGNICIIKSPTRQIFGKLQNGKNNKRIR